MKLASKAITPNQSRLLYDAAVGVAAAALANLLALALDKAPLYSLFIAAPVLLCSFNWVCGIYTRFKVASGPVKTACLTLSVALSAFVMWLSTASEFHPTVILWAAVAWFPSFLPRVFLNLNTRVRTPALLSPVLHDRGAVLIVGGGGYIGTHLIERLLASGSRVRVLDCMRFGKEPIAEFLSNPKFELVEGDATDIVKLVTAIQGTSAVVHLAGLVGDPACAVDESFTRHANIITTRMVKEVALSVGTPRFIFASSCSVYGVNDSVVSETSPLNPVSLYARTKIDSENELLLCPDENFYVTVLRFATVFGHSRRPRFDLVGNLFTAQAFESGKITVMGEEQWRPFIHARDLARAIEKVLLAPPEVVRGQIFNVGDESLNCTIGQLAEQVHKAVSKKRPVTIEKLEGFADKRNYSVSFEKIRSVLGFRAETSLEAGIEEIVREFEKGTYSDYRSEIYSNVHMTRLAVRQWEEDPSVMAKLYAPITERRPTADVSTPAPA